ncbi:glucose-1-phosphate thymidylyltransferase RfbA [Robiginitomaculum antarcticum]|uniref:glucose-1-phosphate thymidylyltransferase RfbA n=1 Tax=Robiginitomaculum antarcticum TaxID=437507 RepID=UPI000477EE6B|nr:glucose-1-phosphate thymidylyltransferase RfbA [Robiginitomaculum antarcticum]
MTRKGIILAGGSGTRLHPSTISVSKQLIPVFDKPMIYYPLTVLMEAGIREILIITTPGDMPAFKSLLSDGKRWGMSIQYAVQPSPDGLAQALIIGEDFLDGSDCTLILGDNLFFGQHFTKITRRVAKSSSGATVFGYEVKDPSRYGVVGFDNNNKVVSLEEKPDNPASNYAVTGLYFYDSDATRLAKTVKPSARGELEITALNQLYLDNDALKVELLDEGTTWLDTGTHKSLLAASQFVSVIEERQGKRICCPEVAAYENKWIDAEQVEKLARSLLKSGYGKYLLKCLKD